MCRWHSRLWGWIRVYFIAALCYTVLAHIYYFWWNKSAFRRYQADTRMSSSKFLVRLKSESTLTACVSGLLRRVTLMIQAQSLTQSAQPQSKSTGSHQLITSITNWSLLLNVVLFGRLSLMSMLTKKKTDLRVSSAGEFWPWREVRVPDVLVWVTHTIRPSVNCTTNQ